MHITVINSKYVASFKNNLKVSKNGPFAVCFQFDTCCVKTCITSQRGSAWHCYISHRRLFL
jgi:hypothetical protein